MEKDNEKVVDSKGNNNFFEIKEQMKRQKNKCLYDNLMKDISPYLKQLKPCFDKYLKTQYEGYVEPQGINFDIRQEEIVKFLHNFFDETITNENLKKKLLDNLYNRNSN